MFRVLALTSVAALMVTLAGCGARVEVPPAHVGKILGQNGFEPETIPPSKFRLPACMWWEACDKLVLLEAADKPFMETLKIFIPADKLNVTLELRGTLAIRSDNATTDPIFDRIVAGSDNWISVEEVYKTYGQQVTRGTVRDVTTTHNIDWIIENRDIFARELFKAVREKLSSTGSPIEVARMQLADFQPPPVIVAAQEANKKREVDIQRAEADAKVAMVEAAKALEVAKMTRLVKKEEALALAEQNRIAASSVTLQLLSYRRLEAIETIAKNGNTIFFPMDMSDGAFNGAFTSELLKRKR